MKINKTLKDKVQTKNMENARISFSMKDTMAAYPQKIDINIIEILKTCIAMLLQSIIIRFCGKIQNIQRAEIYY